MAGGAFVDGAAAGRAALYEYKITPYFIFACVVAASGGSLFGYDLGVSGGVTSMDDFLKEFFPKVYRRKHAHLLETDYCKYDNQLLTLFTSSLYYAALVSTFGASYLTRTKGRRASILVGGASFFIGGVINAAAQNVAMLIIGRVFLGFGIGFGNQVTVGIILGLYFGDGKTLPHGIGYFLVILICLFVLAYGRSWGPLGWLVPSELFPLETRSAGQSIVVCVNMIFTALIAQCFLVALCHLKFGIFLLFAGLILIMTSFVFFFLHFCRSKKQSVGLDKNVLLIVDCFS